MKIHVCKFSEASALAGGLDFHEHPMWMFMKIQWMFMNIQLRENPTCRAAQETPSSYAGL